MDDFPPICKQDPLEVRVMFIKEYYELTGQVIKISDILDEMYGGALPIARNKKSLKRKMTEVEYLDATPEFAAKVAKTSAPESHPPSSDMIIPQQEAHEADDSEHEDPENVVEISSGNSSSHISSDSSDLSEGTLNFIRQIDEKLQKATQSVPNKTDSVNQQTPQPSPEENPSPNYFIPLQMILPEPVAETLVTKSIQVTESESPVTVTVSEQQPKPTHQTTPKQTSTSTPTPTQTQTQNSPQKTIPEPVVETVVPKSVQVTESEQTVAITVSEPIQTQTQPSSTAITNDQPSSSSSTIQTQQQTTPNLLKSEFLEAEMLAINNELQRLVQLRRSPTLKIAYQEQWETLKNRASELLSTVSQKCIKIHNAASMHFVSNVHLVEDQALLYIANTPYFAESEYLTREARIFKLLRQKIVKQQEEAKAKEDLFLQKQLELEATVKMQQDLITQLMNKQA